MCERRRRPGLGDQSVHYLVEVEVPQRPVEVVGPAHGATGLHARVAVDRLTGHGLHHGRVGAEQRLEEHVGELLGGHPLAAPAATSPALAAAPSRLGRLLVLGRRRRRVLPVVDPVLGPRIEK